MRMECVAGCKVFEGNETHHHKDCPHYPESLSKRFDLLQAENKQLKERYKEHEQLWKLADQNNCEGNCDNKYPYKQCPECIAKSAINECGEIRDTALRDIDQALKKQGE